MFVRVTRHTVRLEVVFVSKGNVTLLTTTDPAPGGAVRGDYCVCVLVVAVVAERGRCQRATVAIADPANGVRDSSASD